MSNEDDLLRMPRQGQMAQNLARARECEPQWWQIAPPSASAEGGTAGTNRCKWCFNVFDVAQRRSLAEVEQLRRVLKIDMTTPFDPPICQSCYHTVVGSALPDEKIGEPGSSNHGPGNMLLRERYK